MSNVYTNSPNMMLPIPSVGNTSGPAWASDINASFGLVDSHDHSPGKGVQIQPNGLNISSDLSINDNNLTFVRALRFDVQASAIAASGSDLAELFSAGTNGDLYYNDGAGNQIRLTASGAINFTPTTIPGLSAPASLTYSSTSKTFTFDSNTSVTADISVSSVNLSPMTASSNAVTIAPPSTVASAFTLTLPSATPGALLPLVSDTSGNLSFQLLSGDQINSGSITGAQIANNVVLNGTSVTAGNKQIVVSQANLSGSGLAIMRGVVSADGSIASGEGFTVTYVSTGVYAISYTEAFLDLPAVVATSSGGGTPYWATYASSTASGVTIYINRFDNTAHDTEFAFIASGKRGS